MNITQQVDEQAEAERDRRLKILREEAAKEHTYKVQSHDLHVEGITGEEYERLLEIYRIERGLDKNLVPIDPEKRFMIEEGPPIDDEDEKIWDRIWLSPQVDDEPEEFAKE